MHGCSFLYGQVRELELPWMQMGCPSARKRRPVVLRVQEVQTLLSDLARTESLSGPARLPPSGFQAFLANSQRPLVIFSYQSDTAW